MAARRVVAASLLLLMKTETAGATATTIHFVNECAHAVTWYDGSDSRAVASGEAYSTQLAAGDNAAYRAGVTNDATLAEFAVDESRTWYDISIIPAGSLGGPGSCSSLGECKEVTGGQGFNVAMRIVPSRPGTSSSAVCRTLSCLADGCEDAYQYPDQPDKTHNCAAGVSFEVIFCPSDASTSVSGSSSSSGDWVPLGSASGSGSGLNSNAGIAASNSSSVASDAETTTNAQSTASATASSQSGSEQQVSNNGDAAADSNSSAVIVVAALGATAVVIVLGTIVARHWRTVALNWEAAHRHKPRTSSPTLSFVEIDDVATPQGSRAL